MQQICQRLSKDTLKRKGVSLIEMVIFIVLVGIIATGLMVAFQESLRALPENADDVVAINLAQARMDFLLGQNVINGYGSFSSDVCESVSAPAICIAPAGYTIDSTITKSYGGNANLGTISVSVTGKGTATLQTLIGNAS